MDLSPADLQKFCLASSLVAQTVKSLPAVWGDGGSIPGLGRDPGEGNGHLLQYCCLENPRDRGACRLQSMRSQRVRHDWATNTHSKVQFKSHFFYKHVLRTPLRRPALFFCTTQMCYLCYNFMVFGFTFLNGLQITMEKGNLPFLLFSTRYSNILKKAYCLIFIVTNTRQHHSLFFLTF